MKIDPRYRRTPRAPARPEPSRGPEAARALEALKKHLLEEQLAGVRESSLRDRLQRAAAESVSLAWTTPFPLLTLPELLAEKGREARSQHERQQAIHRRTQATISLSA